MNEPTIFEAHSSYVLQLLFTRDSQTLVSAGMDNVVKLWTLAGEEVVGIKASQKNPSSIAFSPDGKMLSFGGLYGLR